MMNHVIIIIFVYKPSLKIIMYTPMRNYHLVYIDLCWFPFMQLNYRARLERIQEEVSLAKAENETLRTKTELSLCN